MTESVPPFPPAPLTFQPTAPWLRTTSIPARAVGADEALVECRLLLGILDQGRTVSIEVVVRERVGRRTRARAGGVRAPPARRVA